MGADAWPGAGFLSAGPQGVIDAPCIWGQGIALSRYVHEHSRPPTQVRPAQTEGLAVCPKSQVVGTKPGVLVL